MNAILEHIYVELLLITVDNNRSEALLKDMDVANWPTSEKELSIFPQEFTTTETAFILEGESVMTPEQGSEATPFTVGDLLVFPLGYQGRWEVKKALSIQLNSIEMASGNLSVADAIF